MSIARVVSMRSKDPSTKVGAVLVSEDNRIVGTGYNGFVKGSAETEEMWERPEKYKWVIHAELNCILHSVKSHKNTTIYTTMFPCVECSKAIVAAGIIQVVYCDDAYKNPTSDRLLEMGGIKVVKL